MNNFEDFEKVLETFLKKQFGKNVFKKTILNFFLKKQFGQKLKKFENLNFEKAWRKKF